MEVAGRITLRDPGWTNTVPNAETNQRSTGSLGATGTREANYPTMATA